MLMQRTIAIDTMACLSCPVSEIYLAKKARGTKCRGIIDEKKRVSGSIVYTLISIALQIHEGRGSYNAVVQDEP